MRSHVMILVAMAVLVLAPVALAADGPALVALRAKLPKRGTVLVDHQDPATMKPAMAEGSTREVVTLGKDDQMPLAKAVRVSVGKAYPTPYAVQLFSVDTLTALNKGDTVLMSCWVRAPQAAFGQSGLAAFWLQTTGPKWASPASVTTSCERAWKQVFASGIADRDYPAGSLQVAIHLGQQKQVLEFGGLVVLNLGPGVHPKQLPRTRMVWGGMEANAPWRAEAQRRIEKYRMAEIAVQVEDSAGKPVPVAPPRRAAGALPRPLGKPRGSWPDA
jgi:hypothetical protein